MDPKINQMIGEADSLPTDLIQYLLSEISKKDNLIKSL